MLFLCRALVAGGGSWFAGGSLTFADFLAWEVLDQHRLLVPDCLAGLPVLASFMARFEALDKIAAYLTAPRYKQFPIWSARAKYGYHPTN